MNIKFSMPELLVLFSLVMYSQSFTFSVLAFCLGLAGRIIIYLLDYAVEQKKAESMKDDIEEVTNTLKGMFGVKDKESV
jgi:hypothetical protein